MKAEIMKFEKDYPKFSEFLRFLIIGSIATIIDMFVMGVIMFLGNKSAYSSIVDVFFGVGNNADTTLIVLSTAIGFVVGLIVNYYASIYYVYQGENNYAKTKNGFVMFAWLSTIGLIIQTVGMYIGYSIFSINEWLVKIILVCVVLLFNYITRKIFIFKSKDKIIIEKVKKRGFLSDLSIKEIILKSWFMISSVGLMLLLYVPLNSTVLSQYNKLFMVLYIGAIFVISFFLLFFIFKNSLINISFKNKFLVTVSCVMTIVTLHALFVFSVLSIIEKILYAFLACFCVFIYIHVFVSFLFKRVLKFWNDLNKIEKDVFVITLLSFLCFGIVILFFTDIFIAPFEYYDAIFSFDTGYQITFKTQLNIFKGENDFRHFLMTLVQMPFSIIPYMIYCLLPYDIIYGFCLFLIQAVLITYIILTLIKLMNISGRITLIFTYLVFVLSAGVLLNTLVVEKFVLATFYIVATLKLCHEDHDAKWITLVGAIGSLTTSVILLPIVVFYNKKDIKDYFWEMIIFVVLFLMVLLFSGGLNLLLNRSSYEATIRFSSVGENVGFVEKLLQTLSFLTGVFIVPPVIVRDGVFINQAPATFGVFAIIGFILLVCVIISSILNWKNKFSRICAFWNAFMLFLLLIIGWGSVLDEMFIYSLIFGWSIVSSIVMLFNRLQANIRITIISVLLLVVISWNIYSIVNIVSIGENIYFGLLTT